MRCSGFNLYVIDLSDITLSFLEPGSPMLPLRFLPQLEMFAAAYISFVFPFLYIKIRKKKTSEIKKDRAKFVYNIIKELTEAHSELHDNLSSTKVFPNSWISAPYDHRQYFIDDVSDYMHIDAFYTALNSRNNARGGGFNHFTVPNSIYSKTI